MSGACNKKPFPLPKGRHRGDTPLLFCPKRGAPPLFLSIPNLHLCADGEIFSQMPNGLISHHQRGNSISLTQIETEEGEFIHLLNRPGREGYHLVVPMRAPFGLHDVPASNACRLPRTWACPLHINDHTGGLSKCGISDGFLHQTESGPRGRSHGFGACP